MRILIVCPLLPYPLTDAARKSVFYPIRTLARRGHRIHLACLTDHSDPGAVSAIEQYCSVDSVVSPKTPNVWDAIRHLFSSTPYDLRRFHNARLLESIRRRMASETFDLVQVEGIHAAWYGLKVKEEFGVPVVLRVNTVQHVNLLLSAGRYRNPLKNLYLRWEGRKVRCYEIEEGRKFDLNLVISDHDGEVLRRLDASIRCTTVPAGVDLEEFRPGDAEPDPETILWVGALAWPPNRDSFWWFYREIVPRLAERRPCIQIQVAGSNAPPDILAAGHPNLQMLGFVPEIQEVLRRAAICVVPLRIGSGIRMKLLEMFAMRKAVVSTSVGCEGLGVVDGREILVADTPDAFAAAVLRLLNDKELRERLASAALDHVRHFYTWERMGELYEQAYASVLR